jgi:hypothetical protein
MTTLHFWDKLEFDDAAKVKFLDDGRMTAYPRVARTGIQLYLGKEVGLTGDDANKIIRVYRPEAEVFSVDAMKSFTHRAVTNDHPPEPVDASNFKKYAVGWTGDEVARDGQAVRVPMMVADAKAVADYKAGKRELSNGYSCELVFADGVSPQGEAYDATQTNIRGNHVAIVGAARGGSALRIGDHEDRTMNDRTLTTLVVDGAPLQLDAISAGVIQAAMKRITDASDAFKKQSEMSAEELKALKEKADKKDAESVTALAAKDAEIVTLKKAVTDAAVTPAQLDKMVAERNTVVGIAKAIMGDKASALVIDGKTVADIKKQVVDARLGAELVKDWTGVHYDASFASMSVNVKAGDAQATQDGFAGHRPGFGSGQGGTSVIDAARAFAPDNFVADERSKAYDTYDDETANAWRRPVPKSA